MPIKWVLGAILAAAALALFARDLRRALFDEQRRPVTLFVGAAIAVLMVATLGARRPPSAWWLAVPAALLAWEAVRAWRWTPRSRLWQAGMAAFGAALVLCAAALASQGDALLLSLAGGASAAGVGLLWASWRREPRPWRAGDPVHYERRAAPRAGEGER